MMGLEMTYVCRYCNTIYRMQMGILFKGTVGAEDILSGKYGLQAKRNLENHPGKYVLFSKQMFVCECGYLRTKTVMEVVNNKALKSPMDNRNRAVWNNAECKCQRCKKSMTLVTEPPEKMKCRCGKWTKPFVFTGLTP